jgi:hypothetical protein
MTVFMELFNFVKPKAPGKNNYENYYKEEEKMFWSAWDQKNSIIQNLVGRSKVDPGNFSFLETGWWALHAAAITGILIMGSRMSNRNDEGL